MCIRDSSHLADVFEIETFPSLMYLPETQPVDSSFEEGRDLRVLEMDNTLLSESVIRLFVERNTGVKVSV